MIYTLLMACVFKPTRSTIIPPPTRKINTQWQDEQIVIKKPVKQIVVGLLWLCVAVRWDKNYTLYHTTMQLQKNPANMVTKNEKELFLK